MNAISTTRTRPKRPDTAVLGRGQSIGHHGELLQGVFVGRSGEPQRGLVTLPCPRAVVSATYAGLIGDELTVEPATSHKALRAAQLTLRRLGKAHWGGRIEIASKIPTGLGMGSSSGDVIASIRAISNSFGRVLPPGQIAEVAVAAEAASDPLMVGSEAVLFAHREGEVIESFGRQLPPMLVIGVDMSPGGPVDTLALAPAEYEPSMLAEFERLRTDLRSAIEHGDVTSIGRIATASAEINNAYLPKDRFGELCMAATALRAVGVQVAHSGTVAGVLFDAASTPNRCCGISDELERSGFTPSTNFVVGGF